MRPIIKCFWPWCVLDLKECPLVGEHLAVAAAN